MLPLLQLGETFSDTDLFPFVIAAYFLLFLPETDQLDANVKDCELTWLQTAVKVEDDHEEAAQTQGKNQPVHFWFSHAESWRRGGGVGGEPGDRTEPNRLRLETNCCSVYFITDNSLDPTR